VLTLSLRKPGGCEKNTWNPMLTGCEPARAAAAAALKMA
jgi:hypothetical protein